MWRSVRWTHPTPHWVRWTHPTPHWGASGREERREPVDAEAARHEPLLRVAQELARPRREAAVADFGEFAAEGRVHLEAETLVVAASAAFALRKRADRHVHRVEQVSETRVEHGHRQL